MNDLEKVIKLAQDKESQEAALKRQGDELRVSIQRKKSAGVDRLYSRLQAFSVALRDKLKISIRPANDVVRVSLGFGSEWLSHPHGVIEVTAIDENNYSAKYIYPEGRGLISMRSMEKMIDVITEFSAEILAKGPDEKGLPDSGLPIWYVKIGNVVSGFLGVGVWLALTYSGGIWGALLGLLLAVPVYLLSRYLWLPGVLLIFWACAK